MSAPVSPPAPRRRAAAAAAWLAICGLLLAAAPADAGPGAAVQRDPSDRPLLVMMNYSTSGGSIAPGREFDLTIRLANTGQLKARNIEIVFVAGDFVPRVTGGVIAGGVISPGADTGYTQPLTARPDLEPGSIGSLTVNVTYTNDDGDPYSGTFVLSIPIASPSTRAPGGPFPTRTPTPGARPQLLIRGYSTAPDPLFPGSRFDLSLQIVNVGEEPARRVTLIVGGGTSGAGGTPGTGDGGLSGAGGDYTNFAPLGASNVQFLGDLDAQTALPAVQSLIVNSKTVPGAYPLRISLAYSDPRGASLIDDQVITLLVYSAPLLEFGTYRPPDPFTAGQPGGLPLQIVNLGRSSLVLGRLEVTAAGAEVMNGTSTIGLIDSGGYFIHDPMLIPAAPGPLEVRVTVHYLDDFNEPRSLSQTLTFEVLEAPSFPEGEGPWEGPGEPAPPPPQGFWQTLLRALRGLLGLDSAPPQPGGEMPYPMPGGERPIEQPPIPIPLG